MELDGKEPDAGQVYINKEGKIALALKYGNRCYKKGYSDKEVTSLEYTEHNCTIGQLPEGVLATVEFNEEGYPTDEAFNSYLGIEIARDQIRKLEIVNHLNVPNGYQSYDVSKDKNGKVKAWYNQSGTAECYNGETGEQYTCDTYDLYIGGIGGVQGNPDSSYSFAWLYNLEEIDLRHFYTDNVTDMYSMFGGCANLTTLDLSSFNTSKVTDMSGMFFAMYNLQNLDFRNATFNHQPDGYNMFCDVPSSINIIAKDSDAEVWLRSRECSMDS